MDPLVSSVKKQAEHGLRIRHNRLVIKARHNRLVTTLFHKEIQGFYHFSDGYKEGAWMAFRPHRFGRYIIVDPIAVGGMAEIYRARLAASKEGPDRIIVIKKVIANLAQNQEFLSIDRKSTRL